MIRISVRRKLRDFTLDVSIEAGEGETIVLMGSNGSGKTTVLNLVAGLLAPDDGKIEVSGQRFFDSQAGIDRPPEQRNTGYAFQHYALFPQLTVFDNVAFGPRMRGRPRGDVEAIVREELEALGLWELRGVQAAKLSGGQKQRVALARAFAARPKLLLLDEPLSALDMQTCISVRESLRERLKKDQTPCILVLHSPLDALTLGDKAYMLDLGRVMLSGAPSLVLEKGQSYNTQ